MSELSLTAEQKIAHASELKEQLHGLATVPKRNIIAKTLSVVQWVNARKDLGEGRTRAENITSEVVDRACTRRFQAEVNAAFAKTVQTKIVLDSGEVVPLFQGTGVLVGITETRRGSRSKLEIVSHNRKFNEGGNLEKEYGDVTDYALKKALIGMLLNKLVKGKITNVETNRWLVKNGFEHQFGGATEFPALAGTSERLRRNPQAKKLRAIGERKARITEIHFGASEFEVNPEILKLMAAGKEPGDYHFAGYFDEVAAELVARHIEYPDDTVYQVNIHDFAPIQQKLIQD